MRYDKGRLGLRALEIQGWKSDESSLSKRLYEADESTYLRHHQ